MGNEHSTSLFLSQSITTKQQKNNNKIPLSNQKINFYIKKKDEEKLLKEKEVLPIDTKLIRPILKGNDFNQNISTYSTTSNDINKINSNMQENKQQHEQRIRSVSLCTVQLKANEFQSTSSSFGYAFGNLNILNSTGRKSSIIGYNPNLMPTLNRLRIQQSFRDAKPLIGQKILRRACTLRNEFKIFLNNLNNELMDQLAMNIFRLLTDCVVNIDFPFKIASTSSAFGKIFAQLCIFGFRPDLFSVIADSMVTECVRNGGAHKRCETLIAWSQLMQFIFSNVRDGYYSEIRQQRRSSLPQQQLFLKQKHNLNTITTRGSL